MNDLWWKAILLSLISVLSFAQISSKPRENSFDSEGSYFVEQAGRDHKSNIDVTEVQPDSEIIEQYFEELQNGYDDAYLKVSDAPLTAMTWLIHIKRSKEFDDVEYTINDDIQRYLFYFTSEKGVKFITRSLKRGIYYSPITLEVIARSGMPEELVFLPIIESGYRPKARSKAGARGIWQFMRSTARKYGLKVIRYRVDERLDPQRSAEAAMMYLKELRDTLGRWDLAIAAYNAGERRVLKAIEKYKLQHPYDTLVTFWDIQYLLPRETRNYVPQFYALLRIMRDPELYGLAEVFDTLKCDQIHYETIAVSGPTDLRKIARLADTRVSTLRKLNPHILSNRIPGNATNIVLRLPPGSLEALLSEPTPSRG